ncbi:ABC transporter ATP-binding protein [Pseudonocardia sp. GCM10023141]|uniref:ABC transporter ATP-binding protein n=1 Tax=Pseudonocardia sp. GCM10023141 TaxID=3252653 RepID=UPI00360CD36D
MPPLLHVTELRTWIATDGDPVRAVDGVDLELRAGEALGIVGESGSGKSVLARSIMGLLPPTAATSGRVLLDGTDVLTLPMAARRALWGRRVAMIFQDAGRALNPVIRIGRQMCEAMTHHLGISRAEAVRRAVGLLGEVGVPAPERRMNNYPHQLSGGMRQRVMIAMALSCEPALLIADEPTTALDVTVQRQILDLLDRIRESRSMAMILISHDLGLVAGRTDRVAVMYAGRMVEVGPTDALFAAPRHRYTSALLAATPELEGPRPDRMPVIEGSLPDPRLALTGCRFRTRCDVASESCAVAGAGLMAAGPADAHVHACLNPVGSTTGMATVGAGAGAGDGWHR